VLLELITYKSLLSLSQIVSPSGIYVPNFKFWYIFKVLGIKIFFGTVYKKFFIYLVCFFGGFC